jgi:flagellum-specific peptidoglycan hydrolase FlgJ
MTPSEFVKAYLPFARSCEQKTRIAAAFTLAQAAHESGWGAAAPGNMFFGVKDTDGLNGNEQLLRTTEYSQRSDLQFPEIISVTPVVRNGIKYFKYVVKDYFRKYETPEDSFNDHAQFFFRKGRYRLALGVANNAVQMAIQVAKAGYATDPDYANKLIHIIGMIEKEIIELEKP